MKQAQCQLESICPSMREQQIPQASCHQVRIKTPSIARLHLPEKLEIQIIMTISKF